MEPEKLEVIKKYLSFNDVKYYDVQAELIDHFASAVETMEKEHPELSFEESLFRAHRQFGGQQGFQVYIDNTEKNVRRKTLKLIGNALLSFLSWPYALFTFSLAAVWHFVLPLISNKEYYVLGFYGAMIIVTATNHWRLRKVNIFLPKRACNIMTFIVYILIAGPMMLFLANQGNHYLSVVIFAFSSLFLVVFIMLPKLTIEETRKLYPQIA
ncbi:MAG: hypothetical protein WD077_08030 [Bacteroidia bacterium]